MSKKAKNLVAIITIVILGSGLLYWQFSKRSLVKDIITDSVSKSSEGLYKVNYDSSNINELAGNASFYGLSFSADSAILPEQDFRSLPMTILGVYVKKLSLSGADIPSFLTKNSISTNVLLIESPVITIYQNTKASKVTKEDSIALYKAILGKFSSIKADKIVIQNAEINIANLGAKPHTKFKEVNVELNNLLINEQKQYDDIISYFVKDIVVTVKEVQSVPTGLSEKITASQVMYDAKAKLFTVKSVNFINEKIPSESNTINGIRFSGLNTDAFVYQDKFLADSFSIESGQVFIRQNKNDKSASRSFEIQNDFFSRAQLKNIFIKNSDVTIISSGKETAPIKLRKVKFVATNLPTLTENNSLQQILDAGKWSLHSEGLDMTTKDGVYAIKLADIDFNDVSRNLKISKVTLSPLITWAAYVKTLKVQHDLYDVKLDNITLAGINTKALINEGKILANSLTLSPTIKSSNDRTVPFDVTSKVGKYPHQQLLSLDLPVEIGRVNVLNGAVTYRERGRLSEKVGDVVFTSINAVITGFTNTATGIAREKNMVLDAKAVFLNSTAVTTKWVMPLQKLGGNNIITGTFSKINTTALNNVIEPLGMASIRKGTIDGLQFKMYGNDYKSTGEAVLLYHNLKVDVLKSGDNRDNDFEKKGLLSFAANVLIKNSNPRNGNTRSESMNNDRDITKSFFNFIFKGILEASKRTVVKVL